MISRRDLLKATAVLPALRWIQPTPAFAAEEVSRRAPYLALENFILPGKDEFPEESTAFEIERAVGEAFQSGNLPGEQAQWATSLGSIRGAEFQALPGGIVRFGVSSERDGVLSHRTGFWRIGYSNGKITELSTVEEHVATANAPFFRDITGFAFRNAPSFRNQLEKGIPYWRSCLDPATGIDVYGSNGIAVGDVDGDGEDEVYVCQPGGLPNRLYKFRPNGELQDITKAWQVDLLDDTSSALFVDARNIGRQDLVVLRSSGPLLFLNEGGKFRLRTDAFRFRTAPAGAFTGMAAADFDRDAKLDVYLCCYVYFHSEAQYTYATPYHDARNGPPNYLFRNRLNAEGSGFFEDCTAETGMDENNDRFSFAPAWCDFNGDGWPDLFVANDFGRKNLYVNHAGRFRDMAAAAGVEDIGPGMSAAWFDYNEDGNPDLYVGNMWTAAGQRVIASKNFEPAKTPELERAYKGHTMGNSLYRNRGDGSFEKVSRQENVQFGRWAWSSGGHDLDNDGTPEIFVTCGMLTNQSRTDLGSFFWRQVVSRSPITAQPSEAYENGWNAINQFLREDYSWNGNERNVLHAKRGDRYVDVSGVSGLDFAEDGRAFAVCDFDGDGRPDILLKSRLGPQVRVLKNNCAGENHAVAFELIGTKSNRDAVGARIQVDKQTKWLDAGSGFLSQHSKRIIFGLGTKENASRVSILWPSGATQELRNLAAGHIYRITEGSDDVAARPFRNATQLSSLPVEADNRLVAAETWFVEPIPLPEPQSGPKLLTLTDTDLADPRRREQYEIFRRYLFDWRTELVCPLCLLLNRDGHAVKIYRDPPSSEQARADLNMLRSGATPPPLFEGFYVSRPYRDFFKFGLAYMWAGFPQQALPYLERVLARSPGNVRVQVVVAQIYLDSNRLEVAEQAFRKALALDSSNAESLNGLGLALAKQGHFAEAEEQFKQAIASKRDYSDAINNLGVLYAQLGRLNDAISAFEYGIQVAPNEDILYLNLGRLYVQRGRIDRAKEVMERLLDRQPGNETATRALADLNSR